MRRIVQSLTLLSAFLIAVPAMAQKVTLATGYEEGLVLAVHADSPTSQRIRSDEVSAGYDFDGDGKMEFLVLGDQTYQDSLGVATSGASLWLYESGALGFTLVWSWIDTTVHQGGASFPVHAVTDLDGDGFPEVVLGMPHGSSGGDSTGYVRRFYVWEADANGLPPGVGGAPPVPTATWDFDAPNRTDTRPSAIAHADLDQDGDEEMIMGFRRWSDAGGNGAFMVFSLGTGGFAGDDTQWKIEVFDTLNIAETGNVDYAIYSAAATDLDNDGWGEAYFNTDWGTLFEATAADTYTKYGHDYFQGDDRATQYRQWTVHGTASWDLDGDGDEEVIFGRTTGTIRILDGITDLATADTSDMYIIDTVISVVDTLPIGIRGIAVGDFDNNGRADIIISAQYESSLYRMEYKGTGLVTDAASWTTEMIYRADTSRVRGYTVGFGGAYRNGVFEDLDGDGHPDIVIGFTVGEIDDPIIAIISDVATTLLRIQPGSQVLASFRLEQNYPNPFNPSTIVPYSLNMAGQVDLSIFDLLGREVAMLYSGIRAPGEYSATWDGTDAAGKAVATGTYFSRLTVNGQTITRKLSLIK
ncbi:MAG: VCBS repeat-containing protein [Candidatus Marinimicrobia bacterium]|nr:VCBS repeat-containing protein [Candidatus Neomarinimicrobiota bacterium]